MPVFRLAIAACLLLLPAMAFAHPEQDIAGLGHSHDDGGAIAGLTHPVLGLDHLLAMVAVGLLAAQLGGRALWALPASFVGAMLLGGVFGMQEASFPWVELAIICSLAVFGLALAVGRRLPLPLACAMVAFFACFHGHAHGSELPALASPVVYACGFVFSTVLLHTVGVALGRLVLSRVNAPTLLRWTGGAIALVAPVLLML